jgi:hypothetical protein
MSFVCEFCKRIFTQNRNLKQHNERCKQKDIVLLTQQYQSHVQIIQKQLDQQQKHYEEKLEQQQKQYEEKLKEQQKQYEEKLKEQQKQIEKLENQNKEFHNQIFEIAKQPKQNTIHNNNSNNTNNQKINITNQLAVYDLTEESIKSILNEHFTEEVFKGGIDKIKKLVVDKILMNPDTGKPKVLMTDASRLNAKYLTDSGEVKTDVGCEKTYNLLKEPLLRKNVNTYSSLEYDRHSYDRFSENENSIKNKNQFIKKLFVDDGL